MNDPNTALDLEAMFSKEGLKMNWSVDGDRNMSFFLAAVKRRFNASVFHRLFVSHLLLEVSKHIEDYILDFFKSLYSADASNADSTFNQLIKNFTFKMKDITNSNSLRW